MGCFYVDAEVSSLTDRATTEAVRQMLVDTGAEYTWIPGELLVKLGVQREKKDIGFTMANGQTITRSVGFAVIRSGSFFTVDEVVFGEPGDLPLLGARTMEGFNARVDPKQKQLVAAGPVTAASGT